MVASARTIKLDEHTDEVFQDLARRRGISVEELLERLARQAALYEAEFISGVEAGLADANAKRFVSADDIRASVRAVVKKDER